MDENNINSEFNNTPPQVDTNAYGVPQGGAPFEAPRYQAPPQNGYAPQNPYGNPPYGYNTAPQGQYQPPVQTQYIVLPPNFTPKTYEERKDLRRRVRVGVVPSLIMLGISALWATVFYAVMAFLGYSSKEAYRFISEPAVLAQVSLLLSMLIFTVPFLLSAKIAGFRISDLVPINRPKKGTVLPYFLFGMGFCAFANIATSYAGQIFESFGFNYSVDTGDPPAGLFGFLLSVIGTSFVPGLVEEFACRGIMFGVLKKYGDAFAIITTAVIFGLMHGNFVQIPFAFLVGLALGVIRVKTGSMLVCFGVHAANNLVSVLFEYFGANLSVSAQNIIYMVFLMISMLTALVGILILKNGAEEFSFQKPDCEATAKQRYRWFFTSPFVIIFAILCLLESLAFFA